MTVVLLVLVAAAWGLYLVSWWRQRSGRPPLFGRSDGEARQVQPWTTAVLGSVFLLLGAANLSLAAGLDSPGWSIVAGAAFLLCGAIYLVQAWRQRSPESPAP